MKPYRFRKNSGGPSGFGRSVALLSVLLIGFLCCLTVDPWAHEYFHHDAGQRDHACVVTAFAAGEGFFAVPQIEVRPASIVVERVHFAAGEALRVSLARVLPPVCGPPADRLMIA